MTPQSDPTPCSYYGRTAHDTKLLPHLRKHDYPAYSHTCKHCGSQHHFDHMCHSKGKTKHLTPGGPHTWSPTQSDITANTILYENAIFDQLLEGAIFGSLCALQSSTATDPGRHSVALDHHLYNQQTDTWVKQASKAQPFIKFTATVSPNDYAALGFSSSKSPRSITLSVMADSECQSCLAGINTINSCSITDKNFIILAV